MGVRTSDIDTAASGATPASHNSSHQDGGADEVSVTGLSGALADAQKVQVLKNGSSVGTRAAINIIEGSNVTATVADNSGSGRVDVTIAAAGGGGGAWTVSSTKTSSFNAAVNTFYPIYTSAAVINATLPPAAASTGQTVTFRLYSPILSPPVFILGNDGLTTGLETIDGAASLELNGQYETATLICNGSVWYVQTVDTYTANKIAAAGGDITIDSTAPYYSQVLTSTGVGNFNVAWMDLPTFNTNGFRLSPSATEPVYAADSSNSTIYLVPYTSQRIALYSGGSWTYGTSSGTSYTLSGRTANIPFDIFAYFDGGGGVALEVLNWTNSTTRATTVVRQDGVWVKNGDATRRLLGTCIPTTATAYKHSSSATSAAGRVRLGLWNLANQVREGWQITVDAASNWNYTTATARLANGDAENCAIVFMGLAAGSGDGSITAHLNVASSNTTSGVQRTAGIAYGQGVSGGTSNLIASTMSGSSGDVMTHSVSWTSVALAPGPYSVAWCEWSTATGTTTWYSAQSSPTRNYMMFGSFLC